MVKVTVECNGKVVTREGNLAVVAVASEAGDGVVCEQIVQGYGARYLEGAMMGLAGGLPEVWAEHARNARDLSDNVAVLAVFGMLAANTAKRCTRELLEKAGKGRGTRT